MRDHSARALEFAARMQKRRRSALDSAPPTSPSEAETEMLKAKAASLIASFEEGAAIEREAATDEGQVRVEEQLAAVSGRFEPAELVKGLGFEGSEQLAALSSLAPFCSVDTTGQGTFWLLHSDRRSDCLRWLVAQQRLITVLGGALPPTDRN